MHKALQSDMVERKKELNALRVKEQLVEALSTTASQAKDQAAQIDQSSAIMFKALQDKLASLGGKVSELQRGEQNLGQRINQMRKDVDVSVSDLQRTVGGSLQRLTERALLYPVTDQDGTVQALRARLDAMQTPSQQVTGVGVPYNAMNREIYGQSLDEPSSNPGLSRLQSMAKANRHRLCLYFPP